MRRILFYLVASKKTCWSHSTNNFIVAKNRAQGLNPTQREDREVLAMAKKLLHHRLLLFGLAKLSPSYLQRERCFSRCGASRERKGENVFRRPPPRSRPLCRKTKFTTGVAGSHPVQEDATPRRGRLLPGTFCQILADSRPGFWLYARRPSLALPRSLHVKLLVTNWWSDFTTSYAPRTDSNVNEQVIEGT